MIIQRTTVVAAGAVNENVFAGSAFEFPETNVIVSLGAVQSGAGMFITVSAGGRLELEEAEPAISADYPLIPDEFYYNFAAVRGQRLVLRVRNAGGAGLTLRSVAMMQSVR